MFQRQRPDRALGGLVRRILAHNADEAAQTPDIGAAICQTADLSRDIEIFCLNTDCRHFGLAPSTLPTPLYPPVTGGKNATSSPGRSTVEVSANSWFTAQRTVSRSLNAAACR